MARREVWTGHTNETASNVLDLTSFQGAHNQQPGVLEPRLSSARDWLRSPSGRTLRTTRLHEQPRGPAPPTIETSPTPRPSGGTDPARSSAAAQKAIIRCILLLFFRGAWDTRGQWSCAFFPLLLYSRLRGPECPHFGECVRVFSLTRLVSIGWVISFLEAGFSG